MSKLPMTLSESAKITLWVVAGGRCQFEGCNQLLLDGSAQSSSLDDYLVSLTPENPSPEAAQLMLLCGRHLQAVHRGEVSASPQKLLEMKLRHEQRIRLLSGLVVSGNDTCLVYSGPISDIQPDPKRAQYPYRLIARDPVSGLLTQKVFSEPYRTRIRADELDLWADTMHARTHFQALVRRLIFATIGNPELIGYPANVGVQRSPWQGELRVEKGNAWVPSGRSTWSMATNRRPHTMSRHTMFRRPNLQPDKASISEADARNKLDQLADVFVTPRVWPYKDAWLKQRDFHDLKILDATDIVAWLEEAPAVDAWLSKLLGKDQPEVEDLSHYWRRTAGRPVVALKVLYSNKVVWDQLKESLANPPAMVLVGGVTHETLRNVCAAMAEQFVPSRSDQTSARSLIVRSVEAWNKLQAIRSGLVLLPDGSFPLTDHMISEAMKAGHCVIAPKN